MPLAIDATVGLIGALVVATSPAADFSAINFVNGTGLRGKLEVRVDGEPLSTHGYAHGDFSGGLLFPSGGPLRIEASAPGCEPAAPMRVIPGRGTTSIVVFSAAPAPEGAAFPQAVRARMLPHREASASRSVTAVYLGAQPFIVLRVGGLAIRLPADTATEIWRGAGAAVTAALPHGHVQMRLDEPGHYWLILHDQDGGPAGHLLIPDPAYSVPIFDPAKK